MKFHHLARHNQFTAAVAAAAAASQQRDNSSPTIKQLQQQQATSVHQKQISNNNNMTDDEEDEYNEAPGANYYDPGADQQQQLHLHSQQQQAANSNNQPLDSSGFLIDKNKKLFPQKLWELIHNPSIQHCLRWSQDGQRVYLNRNEFEAYYLKTPNNQFHTQKAISFVRQMNMYGFRKVDDCYYENDNFRRDRQHLLRNMIRRHPNKGLFVGLDHHQLAAAAAAQQALQVNQQLQQLEHQHKHRTEQALRLNSYLNSHHHQFHQSALTAAHHQQQQLHNHSSPFEHMSSQLAQAAANHLSQQHHHHHQLQQQHQHQLQQQQQQQQQLQNNIGGPISGGINNFSNNLNSQAPSSLPVNHHQHKKSRLLSNFYASTISNNNNNNNNSLGSNTKNGINSNIAISNNNKIAYDTDNSPANQHMLNQDSMHSTSSVDTQPSQCSSVVNSGSAGSPQPNSPTVLHQRLAALTGATNNRHHHDQSSSSSSAAIRAAVLAASQDPTVVQNVVQKFASTNANNNNNNNKGIQNAATDLSNQSLATRQALHQSLVRSLLQLKQSQQHPQDLLASLQQQNPRTLLESLASLSSVGSSGSVVDPTSNSPTERTATPPSGLPSPREISDEEAKNYGDYLEASNNMALDLAKTSPINGMKRSIELEAASEDVDYQVDIEEGDETEVEDEDDVHDGPPDTTATVDAIANSPLEGANKVRRFLNDQMQSVQSSRSDEPQLKIKRESSDSPQHDYEDSINLAQKKRIKLSSNNNSHSSGLSDDDDMSVNSISKSLIAEICDRRGDHLEVTALQEAARYTECFLEILLEDAALIARHSSHENELDNNDEDDIKNSDSDSEGKQRKGNVVDTSSLSLALKLIPSKLLATIQQQVSMKATVGTII